MPIPDFQTIMRPLLVHLSDGKEHSNQETLKGLAEQFTLTEEELAQLLPSGLQPLFNNRIAWAKTHLKAAGLIESPRRGYYKICPRGLEVLKANPTRVDLRVLNQFPEYVEFRTPKDESGEPTPEAAPHVANDTDKWTPEDHLEYGYQRIREQLAADLLAKVKGASPTFFEKLVVELLLAMGYGGSRQDAGRTVGRGGDGGIDGIINEDRLGPGRYLYSGKTLGRNGRSPGNPKICRCSSRPAREERHFHNHVGFHQGRQRLCGDDR